MSERRVVTVVCNDPGHEGRKVKLLTFRGLPSDDGTTHWVSMRNRSRSAQDGRNQASGRDDWALSEGAVTQSQFDSPSLPERYSKNVYACGLCGEKFSTSDAARLDKVLTAFHRHAVMEIPLTAFRAAYNH